MDDHFIAALPARHPLARRKTIPLTSLANEPLACTRGAWLERLDLLAQRQLRDAQPLIKLAGVKAE